MKHRLTPLALLALAACGPDGNGPVPFTIAAASGDAQSGVVGTPLAQPLTVLVTHATGSPAAGVVVHWSVTAGGGAIAPDSGATDTQGHATATLTLGTVAGLQAANAALAGAVGSPVAFAATAVAASATQLTKYAGDGQSATAGAPLPAPLVVKLADQYGNGVAGVTVTWTVTQGGGSLSAPTVATDAAGLARVNYTLGASAGPNVVSASAPSLPGVTFSATAIGQAVFVTQVPIPANYGIHDTFVRDGLAFVFAWNTGVMIFDVGNGAQSGTPATPQLISTYATVGGEVHNGWWFWNAGQKRYLFIGQEGPGAIGSSSSGDIHVVDVSNLSAPAEVAVFHIAGAGPHNFWMDEPAQRLYAAYYNGGVVALDVSGTLSGDLSVRGIDTIAPGGAGNTYVWGVQLYNGSLYAVDMLSGLWQLGVSNGALSVAGGGNNVPERYGSDLWVANGYAYTGTWGGVFRNGNPGNAVKVWQLLVGGAPVLADSIITANITTVSDVEVSPDGRLLMFSAEGGSAPGFYFYGLTNPARPAYIANIVISTGVHTATFGTINGRLYAFGAKDPGSPALLIYDVTSLIP